MIDLLLATVFLWDYDTILSNSIVGVVKCQVNFTNPFHLVVVVEEIGKIILNNVVAGNKGVSKT